MGYIYCITNLINCKRYVGKTTQTPEERFKEHCRDSQKERCNKRPLYDAFNKYGVENFKVEELEYIEDDNLLSDKEIYWINELNTYGSNGYNASKGGDGTILYDYNEIIELLNLGYTTKQVCDKVGCCPDTVQKVAKAHNIKIRHSNSKVILQYDLADNYIQTFQTLTEAMQWLVDHGFAKNIESTSKLTACCKGKSKSAFKYKWRFPEQ